MPWIICLQLIWLSFNTFISTSTFWQIIFCNFLLIFIIFFFVVNYSFISKFNIFFCSKTFSLLSLYYLYNYKSVGSPTLLLLILFYTKLFRIFDIWSRDSYSHNSRPPLAKRRAHLTPPCFTDINCHVRCGDGAVCGGLFMTLIGDQQTLDTRWKKMYISIYTYFIWES